MDVTISWGLACSQNLQPVLMSAYGDAGLKQLAEAAGFRAATLTALMCCSSFHITHNFLMQAGEAIMREMVHVFLAKRESVYKNLAHQFKQLSSDELFQYALNKAEQQLNDGGLIFLYENFLKLIQHQSETDSTWKFWKGFIYKSFNAYLTLYISIRSRQWTLRIAALKEMAPLFWAFDRPTYSRLVPDHLSDITKFPKEVVQCFQRGGFAVSFRQ